MPASTVFSEWLDILKEWNFTSARTQPSIKVQLVNAYQQSVRDALKSILAQAETGNLFDAAIWDCPFDSTDRIIERSIERLKLNIGGYEFSLPGRSLLKKYAYNS